MLSNNRSSFHSKRKNQEGMAMFEMIPILIIILLLMNFSIGFFGVIHTGILNSIAARNYAFETFRHRSNLTYFMTNDQTNASKDNAYEVDLQRTHTTLSESAISDGSNTTKATARPIDFFEYNSRQVEVTGTKDDHNKSTNAVIDGKRYQGNGVNPVWIKTAYGICLNTTCGE